MAIQPRFAQAILAGTKTVEFRKRALAPDVDTVLIYETAPTQRVVGIFKVDDIVRLPPSGLWRRFGSAGSISRPEFMNYYDSNRTGVGLVVGAVARLAAPVSLSDLQPRPAVPQSFSYLPAAAVLDQIEAIQARRVVRDATLLPA